MKSREEYEGKKKLPREQQLNENSSLKPKRVQSSRNCQNKGSVVCFQQPRCCTAAPTSAQLDPDLREKPAFVWKGHVTPRVSAHKAAVSHSNASGLRFPSAAAGLPRDNTVKTQLRSSPDCRSLYWKWLLVHVTTAAAQTGNSFDRCHKHQIPLCPCREYKNIFLSFLPLKPVRRSHMCSFTVIKILY